MDKQDAVNRGGYVFAKTTTFEEAFPMIASLTIVLEVRREGFTQPDPQTWRFTLENPPDEYIRCPRSPKDCKQGGWPLVALLCEMVAQKQTSRQAGGRCHGAEPMGRWDSRPCKAYFKADISITYKENGPAMDGLSSDNA
jgi:hypothetical protein